MEKIDSLQTYLQKIDSIFKKSEESELLYRGQADYYWPIKSSACRFFSMTYPILELSPTLMTDYIEKQKETIKKFTNEENPHYSLRHFGGHTPYIDFSRNCLVALYFACEELQGLEDGAVYIVPNSTQIGELDEISYRNNQAESRMRAQYACFINPSGIEVDKQKLVELIIDKDAKAEIIRQLKQLQISRTTIYPDLMEYIKQQGQYTDVFKDVILEEIIKLQEDDYKKYPDVITSLLNLQRYKRITNDERKMIFCLLIKYYIKNMQPDKALEMLDEISLKENKIIENGHNASVVYQYKNKAHLTIFSFMRGQCYILKKMYKRALHEFEKAIQEIDIDDNRKFWEGKNLLHEVIKIRTDIRNKMAYPMIKLNPENLPDALELLSYDNETGRKEKRASLYYECGKFNEAIEEVKNLKTDTVENLRGRCYIGLHKEQKGQGVYLELARESFKKAAERTDIIHSLDHKYKLASTYLEKINHRNDFDEAIKIYDELSRKPFLNEDAKHKVAKYTHKKAQNEDSLDFAILAKAVQCYIAAIKDRRRNNNAMNFVDLAEILSDIYQFEDKYPEREKETAEIKKQIHEEFKKLTKFRESEQSEIRKLLNTIKDIELTDKNSLLFMNVYLLQIVVAIYPEDEFAYNKLGILYETLWQNSKNEDYADKALAAYNNSRYFYIKKGMFFKKEKAMVKDFLDTLNNKINSLIVEQLKYEKQTSPCTE